MGPAYTVTLNSNVTVDSLTLNSANATLNQTGGTLSAVNGISVQAGAFGLSGTVLNTTVATSGGSVITAYGGTLDGVTLNGEVDVAQQTQASLGINHDSTLNGTMLVGSAVSGSVNFGRLRRRRRRSRDGQHRAGRNSNTILDNFNSGTLTLGSAVTIHGQNGTMANVYAAGTILNQGTIHADVSGGHITVGTGTVTSSNAGTC